MATEKSLKEYIQIGDDICTCMMDARVADARVRQISLVESLHYELLKLAVFIVDADSDITEDERNCIKEYLNICPSVTDLHALKYRERLDTEFLKGEPAVLKYAVLSDAGKKTPDSIYSGHMAQTLCDLFCFFGRALISCSEVVDEKGVKRLNDFISMMEDFLKSFGVYRTNNMKMFVPKEAGDNAENPERLNELLDEFNAMIGLEGVKREVNSLVSLLKVQMMRKERGLKNVNISKHMVFTGNPGTGKTTVARILSEIYKNLGILKKGQLVEVDRSGLVRGFVGQTATRVQEVVDEAMNGILFIDEAYTLTYNKGEGDFGQEAVDTLLKAMEDNRENLVVIVAGYTEEMQSFLESNPGLKSRFNKYIFFEDFTAGQLMQILTNMCQKQDYILSEAAKEAAYQYFKGRTEQYSRNFANAREVRNFLETAISNQACRLMNVTDYNENILSTIEPVDLPAIIS